MNATLDKVRLWSFRQAAILMGLDAENGYRVVSAIVAGHKLPTQRVGTAICIDRSGLKVVARALNRDLSAT